MYLRSRKVHRILYNVVLVILLFRAWMKSSWYRSTWNCGKMPNLYVWAIPRIFNKWFHKGHLEGFLWAPMESREVIERQFPSLATVRVAQKAKVSAFSFWWDLQLCNDSIHACGTLREVLHLQHQVRVLVMEGRGEPPYMLVERIQCTWRFEAVQFARSARWRSPSIYCPQGDIWFYSWSSRFIVFLRLRDGTTFFTMQSFFVFWGKHYRCNPIMGIVTHTKYALSARVFCFFWVCEFIVFALAAVVWQ